MLYQTTNTTNTYILQKKKKKKRLILTAENVLLEIQMIEINNLYVMCTSFR